MLAAGHVQIYSYYCFPTPADTFKRVRKLISLLISYALFPSGTSQNGSRFKKMLCKQPNTPKYQVEVLHVLSNSHRMEKFFMTAFHSRVVLQHQKILVLMACEAKIILAYLHEVSWFIPLISCCDSAREGQESNVKATRMPKVFTSDKHKSTAQQSTKGKQGTGSFKSKEHVTVVTYISWPTLCSPLLLPLSVNLVFSTKMRVVCLVTHMIILFFT